MTEGKCEKEVKTRKWKMREMEGEREKIDIRKREELDKMKVFPPL